MTGKMTFTAPIIPMVMLQLAASSLLWLVTPMSILRLRTVRTLRSARFDPSA